MTHLKFPNSKQNPSHKISHTISLILIIMITLITEIPSFLNLLPLLLLLQLLTQQQPLVGPTIHHGRPIIILKPLTAALPLQFVVPTRLTASSSASASPPFLLRRPLPRPQLVLRALITQVPIGAALVAPALVLVLSLLYKLGGAAVVGGDRGRELPAVEDLPVHLTRGGDCVAARDELDEGDAAALARVPILEDRDPGDLAEAGEESVEVGVGKRVVQVRDVEGRFRRS